MTKIGEIQIGCSRIKCTHFRLSDAQKCKEKLNESHLQEF